ncbi:MAG: tyrosine/serine/threonine protein phosphatase pps1 [Pycnora praestabilis]|nr:MAG: tyrosine/serine/threonine protein phosphatase pps1 [Pycnora praestabilis]
MATLVVRSPPLRQSPTPPPAIPTLSLNIASQSSPVPVPNKHLPVCSPGPSPAQAPATPPASPPTKHLNVQTLSVLYPPENHLKICDSPPIYSVDAETTAAALHQIASQPLPEAKQVFPWLHGLHPENHVQLAFFIARRKSLRRTPKCIRAITIVKVGGNLDSLRLKGAIAPGELLPGEKSTDKNNLESGFLEVNPKDGFSVRNFQIQTGKMAMVSDIVLYGHQGTDEQEVLRVAKRVAQSQRVWKEKHDPEGNELPSFSTFVLSSPFSDFEKKHPDLVAVDSKGQVTGNVMDFCPTPESPICPITGKELENPAFDILIEANDLAQVPDSRALKLIAELLERTPEEVQQMEFPSSGSIMPPTWSQTEVDGMMETCRWMYGLANPELAAFRSSDKDQDGDFVMDSQPMQARKILIHCTDGYTESSLLALAYFMYAEGASVDQAWLRLHCEKQRNFFAYPSDVALLASIQPRILQESPRNRDPLVGISEPPWLARMDGSLPSRILPYMYLGNLGHANNPELLRAMGIKRILSVGEPVAWSKETEEKWGSENVLFVDRVQDNGVDPLTEDFDRCLKFIEKGRLEGTATLVHCRVGVSRSATICIAEVMSHKGLSFPRAYCFVRARRLNVIIQPHLRFSYELLKWEELQQEKRNKSLKRELEWATIAREIALMNKPYSRQ